MQMHKRTKVVNASHTCSLIALQPRSSVRSHSYVSPSRGLNGLAVLNAVVAYDDTVKAATSDNCSQVSSI